MHVSTTLLAVSLLGAGCGGSPRADADPAATSSPAPESFAAVESAAEDIIDLALAGDRAGAIAQAGELDRLAQGEAGRAALAAGVSPAVVDELEARAAEVARIAPSAPLLDLALAANRAFELVPELFQPFESDVPVEVLRLDYLDFEAKLQATSGSGAAATAAVERLAEAWRSLQAAVDDRDKGVAASFTTHVRTMRELAGRGALDALAAEAQHGLDLVDLVEQAFA